MERHSEASGMATHGCVVSSRDTHEALVHYQLQRLELTSKTGHDPIQRALPAPAHMMPWGLNDVMISITWDDGYIPT